MVNLLAETNTVLNGTRDFFRDFIPELSNFEGMLQQVLPDVFTYSNEDGEAPSIAVIGSNALQTTQAMKLLTEKVNLDINPVIYFVEQTDNFTSKDYIVALRWIALELRSISTRRLIEFTTCDIFYLRRTYGKDTTKLEGDLIIEYISPSNLKEMVKLEDLLKTAD